MNVLRDLPEALLSYLYSSSFGEISFWENMPAGILRIQGQVLVQCSIRPLGNEWDLQSGLEFFG